MRDKKITKAKIKRYAVLCVLEEAQRPVGAKELQEWTGIPMKDIITALRNLLSWSMIDPVMEDDHKKYVLSKKGVGTVKFYREVRHLDEYYTPPWRETPLPEQSENR